MRPVWWEGISFKRCSPTSRFLRFGIDVVVIEPGGIKTEWAGIAADKLRDVSGKGPYASQAQCMAESMVGEVSRKRQSPPVLVADTVAKAVSVSRPKTRYAVRFGAKPMIFMRRLLSDRAFDGLMRMATGISRQAA